MRRRSSAIKVQASWRGELTRRNTCRAQGVSWAVEEEAAEAEAEAAPLAAPPSPPRPLTRAEKLQGQLHALLLSLALVVCLGASLLLFWLTESAQCRDAGGPAPCLRLLLGLSHDPGPTHL